MGFKEALFRLSVLFLLFILSFIFACSTPSWFPIKKGSPNKAKMKELLDKEVFIIDGEEYVKVVNPRASEKENQPSFLYVPVDEYLSKRESFKTPTIQKQGEEEAFPISSITSSSHEKEVGIDSPPTSRFLLPNLKKKVVIAYFDDRTTPSEELFGDWVAEKLIKEINRRSRQILFIDYQTVIDFLEKSGVKLSDLETPKVLLLLNEVFGVQAWVAGELAGPYVFTTNATKGQEQTASAILKIEMRLIDTYSGKTIKTLSTNNPITGAKEKGSFSEEKAKIKAIDLTIAELGRSLSKELDGLDWFCRIAKVDEEAIYINAGKLTGLNVGDVMEVFRPEVPEDQGRAKGKIRISEWFGIDASIGKLIQGEKPNVNDILKIAKSNSTIGRGM
jgi:hypothetical protein